MEKTSQPSTPESTVLRATIKLSIGMVGLAALMISSGQAVLAAEGVVATAVEEGIVFEARGPYQSITVRVVGEDQVVQVKFAEDDRKFFSPREFSLPDGKYTYEAVVNPRASALLRESSNQGAAR